VAFLVAAVAQSASEAVIMKADCYEFRRMVVALEKVPLHCEPEHFTLSQLAVPGSKLPGRVLPELIPPEPSTSHHQ
jgi:hypothetical protein